MSVDIDVQSFHWCHYEHQLQMPSKCDDLHMAQELSLRSHSLRGGTDRSILPGMLSRDCTADAFLHSSAPGDRPSALSGLPLIYKCKDSRAIIDLIIPDCMSAMHIFHSPQPQDVL